MKYTQTQIEKLLNERRMLRRQPHCKELIGLDAELDQVFRNDRRGFVDAAKTVYQEAA